MSESPKPTLYGPEEFDEWPDFAEGEGPIDVGWGPPLERSVTAAVGQEEDVLPLHVRVAGGKAVDLETMPFDRLEEAYNRRKRKEMMAILESVPFDMLEESYNKRKRLKSTINLTSDDSEKVLPDGSGVAIQSQLEQQHTFLQVKKEQEIEISNIKEKIEEEKKKSAAHQLNLDRMKECVVCQDADRCVALFPCSHLALCAACQYLVKDCPLCREKIEERKMIKVA